MKKGTPVTTFVKTIKQPRGGFVKVSDFNVMRYNDGKTLTHVENMNPGLTGLVVDYMTRFLLTGDVIKAFAISLKGAKNIRKYDDALLLTEKIKKLNNEAVKAAYKLVKFDVVYRYGLMGYNSADKTTPDMRTISNVIILIKRTVKFFETKNNLKTHITFEGGYSDFISAGDADFMDDTTLWDLKVSVSKPTSRHILQLIVYQILFNRSDNGYFINNIGFFNPRLNCSYLYDLNNMDIERYKTIEGMIKYGPDYVHEKEYGVGDEVILLRLFSSKDNKEISLDMDGYIDVVERASSMFNDNEIKCLNFEMVTVIVSDIVNNLPKGEVVLSYPDSDIGHIAYGIKRYLWKINGQYFIDYNYFEQLLTIYSITKYRIHKYFKAIINKRKSMDY